MFVELGGVKPCFLMESELPSALPGALSAAQHPRLGSAVKVDLEVG